ncbi:hypothetical protein ACFOY4_01620 [Actinomadura syzygii]|nr:hypothetical protein [Actinomadura syzygii]
MEHAVDFVDPAVMAAPGEPPGPMDADHASRHPAAIAVVLEAAE